MMNKTTKYLMKYLGAFLLFLLAGGLVAAKPCQAASAEIEISSDSTELTIGDKIFVYVTVTTDTQSDGVEANLTYDEDILELSSRAQFVTGSNGFLKISDMEASSSDTRKYTMEFEALEVGTCEIALSGSAMVYDSESGDAMSVSSNVLTINVKAAQTASSNAYLQSLKINPSVLSPEFNKNVFEYNTSVGYETQNLIIDALPEDKKASVSISGNDFLKEGENKIIITVLAESGAVIEYTINVTKEAAPKGDTTDTSTTPDSVQNALKLLQADGQIYAVYEGKYKLIEPDSGVLVPAGYIKSKIIISDISVNAYYPENNMDSEFLLIYAENDKGAAGFYQYDKIEKTLQRYVPEKVSEADETGNQGTEQDLSQLQKYRDNLNKAALIIALLSVLCIILIVFMIRLLLTSKGHKRRR